VSTVLAQGGTTNFLLPNSTFIVELLIFLVILFVFHRYIVPPLSRALKQRQDMVRKQAEDREKAARAVQEAQERYSSALADARAEAASIRDDARAEAARVRAELREQADQEVERIQRQGGEQLAAQRAEAMRRLRSELGGLSVQLAERVVGESFDDDGRRRSTVERFLAELERTPASGGTN